MYLNGAGFRTIPSYVRHISLLDHMQGIEKKQTKPLSLITTLLDSVQAEFRLSETLLHLPIWIGSGLPEVKKFSTLFLTF